MTTQEGQLTSQYSLPSASLFLARAEADLPTVASDLDGVFTLAFLATGEVTSSSGSDEAWRFLVLGMVAAVAMIC